MARRRIAGGCWVRAVRRALFEGVLSGVQRVAICGRVVVKQPPAVHVAGMIGHIPSSVVLPAERHPETVESHQTVLPGLRACRRPVFDADSVEGDHRYAGTVPKVFVIRPGVPRDVREDAGIRHSFRLWQISAEHLSASASPRRRRRPCRSRGRTSSRTLRPRDPRSTG